MSDAQPDNDHDLRDHMRLHYFDESRMVTVKRVQARCQFCGWEGFSVDVVHVNTAYWEMHRHIEREHWPAVVASTGAGT